MIRHTGFLLSYIKYGDNDAVLCFYLKEEGYRSFFLRGLYSHRSKKKALVSPMSQLSFNENKKGNGLSVVTGLERVSSFDEQDVKVSSIRFFVAELLNYLLRNEPASEAVYREILEFANELNKGNFSAHVQFMVLLTQLLGIEPLVNEQDFLHPKDGTFGAGQTHHLFNRSVSSLWRKVLQEGFAASLTHAQRNELLETVLIYYELHIPEFRRPKSLDVLRQILS